MDKETLKQLELALESSPANHVLRGQIAKGYFTLGEYEAAKRHFSKLIETHPTIEFKLALAQCFLKLGNPAPGIMICEELLDTVSLSPQIAKVYLQLLIHDGQYEEAIENYQDFQSDMPGWEEVDIELQLKIPAKSKEEEAVDEESYAFFDHSEIDFSHVGGMQDVKDEIRIKIIEPIANPELFKAFGKKAGGGILLFGPPGCGKTYLAQATAGEIDSKFMAIGINDIMDMWLGNSEKNLHHRFEVARKHSPCVMFFDEIDALGSKRNDLRQSSARNLINQFLKELDGIDSDNDGLLILGATNSPWHMDSAFLRPGRFDRIIFVPPPDLAARIKILELMLMDKPCEAIDHRKLAEKTAGFSGADLMALVDYAVEDKLRKSLKSGKIEKLRTKDFISAVKKVRPSTKEWFNTAKNYALYSNSSGIYDEVKVYLNL